MSRHTPIDRFTLPKDIRDLAPDLAHDLAPNLVPGEIPSPTDECWSQSGGGDPVDHSATPANAPARPQASAPDGEAVRGYVMRSAAGRGWAPEEGREPVTMVEGLPHTAEDLRLREAGESAAPSHARPGPAPLLTPRKQAAFCKVLANHGNVRLACRAVRVSAQTAYRARRASAAFRQCWDAALVIAREHVEQVLADRALNGVEEKVFYHGEEVATRTRYDSRLLLAHLARLDKRAGEAEACASCEAPLLGESAFDDAVDALEQQSGEGAISASGQCSMCSTLAAESGADPASGARIATDAGGKGAGRDLPPSQPSQPSFEARLCAMEDALPPGAQAQSGLPDAEWWRAEEDRLLAFEAGRKRWWLAAKNGAAR